MPTASSQRRNTWVCLASSNANCVRYISSPSRPSARIAAMKGWMSWVTASSPAMNSAHSRVAQSRSPSESDSQSARSREKSMSAGSQNFALPPANSFNGRLFQLSPPALIDCECVRVMFYLLRSKVLGEWVVRRQGGGLALWGYGRERGGQDCDEPPHGQCRLLRRRFVKPEDR